MGRWPVTAPSRTIIPEVVNLRPDEIWILTGEWREQRVDGYANGMRFWFEADCNSVVDNRIRYIGRLLLARVRFSA